MKYLKVVLLLLMVCCGFSGYAQGVTFSGQVLEKSTKEPLAGVLVSVRNAENIIVKYGQTTSEGKFAITFAQFPDNHILYFSMMGFAPQSITIIPGQTTYNVSLSEKATDLKEVIVKAPSIYEKGDTIRYVVSSFANVQDKSLADVLKKMPGIEVEKSGQIKYNGVAINKFYIEGKDMLGGQYGIATNNIHQKDVGSVEVMENHQPIKALEDISFSQNPAINIHLKEDAKARWVGTMKIAIGATPFLWKNETALMRFKKKSQTLNTYKMNNTGNDVTQENMSFSLDAISTPFGKNYRLENYISVNPDRLFTLDDERSRFNTTHVFTTNNLWTINKNYDLTSQISYTNNRLKNQSLTRTSYFLQDSTIINEINEDAFTKQNRLTGDVTLTANTPKLYLKNKLFADVSWNDINTEINGTYPNAQHAALPYRQISNDLEILKREGKRAYNFNSYNSYQTKNQQLLVERANEKQSQDVEAKAFYTNTNTSLSFYVAPFSISMRVGLIGLARSLQTNLSGVSDTLGNLRNNITMKYLQFYISPEFEYKKNSLEAKFSIPVSYVPHVFTDKINDNKEQKGLFYASPKLYLRYLVTSRLSMSFLAGYSPKPIAEQSFYEGIVLNNYRNISKGFVNFSRGNSKSLSLDIRYKNPIKTFFVNGEIIRSWMYSPFISNRYFLDEYLFNTDMLHKSNTSMWMANASVSKGVDFLNSMVILRASYSDFKGESFQNGKNSPYISDTWSVSGKLTSRITNWCKTAYEIIFEDNKLKLTDTNVQHAYNNFSQNLSVNFNPSKVWYLQLTAEHYYNEITKDVSKNFFLADINFTSSLKKGWELNISAKNIFNQKVYAYKIYDGLSEMNKEYIIRPRNIMVGMFFRF